MIKLRIISKLLLKKMLSMNCRALRLQTGRSGEAASLFQTGVVSLAVVRRLRLFLGSRFDAVQKRNCLLEQSPAVFERPLIDVDDLVRFRIDRVLHLADDWAI